MPRHARVKARTTSCYYHCMNRIAGPKDWYPFGDVEKDKFVRILKEYARLYTIEIISYAVLGNHFHCCLWVTDKRLSAEAACDRYNRFYKKTKNPLTQDDPERCKRVIERLRDLSMFWSEVQQTFTRWYNHRHNRRGTLWSERFKSVILEGKSALWNVIKYIELNPVRAGLVDDPADYRFSSWGAWCGSGRHPFATNFHKHVRRYYGLDAAKWSVAELEAQLRADMATTIARECGCDFHEIRDIHQHEKAHAPAVSLQFLRRSRYYSESLILGSQQFIDTMMQDLGDKAVQTQRELQHKFDELIVDAKSICAFHHLCSHGSD